MLRNAVRGVTAVAVELVTEAGKVAGQVVERVAAEPFPPTVKSLQTLAGEALTVGRAGVDLAVGVARSETERIFERVGDQVVKVGVVLGYLESKLREVDEEPVAKPEPRPRAEGLFQAGWETEPAPAEAREPEPVVEEEVEEPAPVKKAAAKKATAAKKTAVKKTAAKKAAPAKKTTRVRKAVAEGE